ncbi:MAG: hypothetical protein U1E65_27325 [Myxococcota bacterium]
MPKPSCPEPAWTQCLPVPAAPEFPTLLGAMLEEDLHQEQALHPEIQARLAAIADLDPRWVATVEDPPPLAELSPDPDPTRVLSLAPWPPPRPRTPSPPPSLPPVPRPAIAQAWARRQRRMELEQRLAWVLGVLAILLSAAALARP